MNNLTLKPHLKTNWQFSFNHGREWHLPAFQWALKIVGNRLTTEFFEDKKKIIFFRIALYGRSSNSYHKDFSPLSRSYFIYGFHCLYFLQRKSKFVPCWFAFHVFLNFTSRRTLLLCSVCSSYVA